MPTRVSRLALALALCVAPGGARAGPPPIVGVHGNVWNHTSDVMLVDPETLQVIGTVNLKGGVTPLHVDAAGETLYLITQTLSKKRATSLVSVDTRTASSTDVADLGDHVVLEFLDSRRTRLYVVAGAKTSKPKIISSVELPARNPPRMLASVERLTAVRLSPDDSLLYALCDGQPHKKPKGPPGSVHILDATTGTESARLEAESKPTSVAFDTDRGLAYVLGATDARGNGTVTVVRGTSVAARLATPGIASGLRLAPDGRSFLLTSRAVVALDDRGLAVARSWDLDFNPSDLIFDPEHDLMFAGAGPGSKIAEMRISGGEVLVEHATGSAGRKFGKGVGAALYFVLAVAAAAGGAAVPSPFLVPSSTSMALGEDGSTLYVLNTYTNDVSIFDVAKQDVVDIVHVGGSCRRIVQLPGTRGFWVEASDRLARLDPVTHRLDRTLEFHGLLSKSFAYDPERARAWISVGSKLMAVDLRGGAVSGQADLPKAAGLLWYEPPVEDTAPRP